MKSNYTHRLHKLKLERKLSLRRGYHQNGGPIQIKVFSQNRKCVEHLPIVYF